MWFRLYDYENSRGVLLKNKIRISDWIYNPVLCCNLMFRNIKLQHSTFKKRN